MIIAITTLMMNILRRLFGSAALPPPEDRNAIVLRQLQRACARRGWANWHDVKNIPQASVFRIIKRLVEDGHFLRVDGKLYNNPRTKPSVPAEPAAALPTNMTTAQLQQRLQSKLEEPEPTPPQYSPEVLAAHRKICGEKPEESSPDYFHDPVLTWNDLVQRLPATIIEWARHEFDSAMRREISPRLAHENILKRAPETEAWNKFVARFPFMKNERRWFETLLIQKFTPERITQLVEAAQRPRPQQQ